MRKRTLRYYPKYNSHKPYILLPISMIEDIYYENISENPKIEYSTDLYDQLEKVLTKEEYEILSIYMEWRSLRKTSSFFQKKGHSYEKIRQKLGKIRQKLVKKLTIFDNLCRENGKL